jgi:hypothetical protein
MSKRKFAPEFGEVKASSQAYERLIDYAMHIPTGGGWKTMCYIARHTVGFNKVRDSISLSQICRGIKTRDGRRLDYGTGLSRKAAVRAVAELEAKKLVIVERGFRADTNGYAVNWSLIGNSRKETSGESKPTDSGDSKPEVVANRNTQPTVQPTGLQPTGSRDTDCPVTNRKERDSQPGVSLPPSKPKQYQKLRTYLAHYMGGGKAPADPRDFPSDRQVVDVIDSALGATEADVCKCLLHLYNERGLRPGTEHGPRHYKWFPTVVEDYFNKQASRAEVAGARGGDYWSSDGASREA